MTTFKKFGDKKLSKVDINGSINESVHPNDLRTNCNSLGTQCDQTFPEIRAAKALHPGGDPGAKLKSISHKCHLILVAFVWETTKETINLPPGCLQGGVAAQWRVSICIVAFEQRGSNLYVLRFFYRKVMARI